MCDSGFHSCADPLDVLNYYDITSSRFATVKAGGTIIRKDDGDSKICSASLTVVAELKLPEFIRAAVDATIAICKASKTKGSVTDGDYATNASSGNSAKNASSGYYATNASSGYSAKNASSGYSAKNDYPPETEVPAPRAKYVPSPEYLAWCAELDGGSDPLRHLEPRARRVA
jgi:hypothetical protein